MDTFACQNKDCGKIARSQGLHYDDGIYYVDCNHCGARHETEQLPTPTGAPLEFRVVGLGKPK